MRIAPFAPSLPPAGLLADYCLRDPRAWRDVRRRKSGAPFLIAAVVAQGAVS